MAKSTHKKRCIYVGIDPGMQGAVAALDDDGFLGVWDTPTLTISKGKTKKGNAKHQHKYAAAQMVDILEGARFNHTALGMRTGTPSPCVIGLELVHSMPGQGATSMFSMGRGTGLWEGIIAALRLPSQQVTPQAWKKMLMGGETGKTKQASIVVAQRLFPKASAFLSRKKDDGRADAILIAEYVRRGNQK